MVHRLLLPALGDVRFGFSKFSLFVFELRAVRVSRTDGRTDGQDLLERPRRKLNRFRSATLF